MDNVNVMKDQLFHFHKRNKKINKYQFRKAWVNNGVIINVSLEIKRYEGKRIEEVIEIMEREGYTTQRIL